MKSPWLRRVPALICLLASPAAGCGPSTKVAAPLPPPPDPPPEARLLGEVQSLLDAIADAARHVATQRAEGCDDVWWKRGEGGADTLFFYPPLLVDPETAERLRQLRQRTINIAWRFSEDLERAVVRAIEDVESDIAITYFVTSTPWQCVKSLGRRGFLVRETEGGGRGNRLALEDRDFATESSYRDWLKALTRVATAMATNGPRRFAVKINSTPSNAYYRLCKAKNAEDCRANRTNDEVRELECAIWGLTVDFGDLKVSAPPANFLLDPPSSASCGLAPDGKSGGCRWR